MTEYEKKRANALKEEMTQATKKCDKDAFMTAYNKSFRYLGARERKNYYIMFISHMMN